MDGQAATYGEDNIGLALAALFLGVKSRRSRRRSRITNWNDLPGDIRSTYIIGVKAVVAVLADTRLRGIGAAAERCMAL